MSIVGYGRVSSVGQSLDVQISKLTEYGCEKIFSEKKTGTNVDREQFKTCMDYLREGDKLVITRLDRLCRSVLHLSQISEELKNKNVDLVVMEQNIDTSTSTGRLLFNMLGVIGEFENEIRKERQLDGIRKSKERGVKFGRKSKLTREQVVEMKGKRDSGVEIKDLVSEFGISRESVYRLMRTI
jgi:DNA invertase Pin-like site-specific DNA recombinase